MGAFAVETKMHYPVMTEKQLATRWKISVKTLRRWRLDKVGPVWRKLFRYVRYHDSDVIDFERKSAQNWMGFLGRNESETIMLTPETTGSDSGRGDQDYTINGQTADVRPNHPGEPNR